MDSCPNCKKDIRKELVYELLGRMKGNNFEHECSFCGALLEVDVVPVPEFEMSVKELPFSDISPATSKDDTAAYHGQERAV